MNAEIIVKYSLFVPLYNELENIQPLYSKVTAVMERIGEPY